MTKGNLDAELKKLVEKYEDKALSNTKAPFSSEFLTVLLLGQIWKKLK